MNLGVSGSEALKTRWMFEKITHISAYIGSIKFRFLFCFFCCFFMNTKLSTYENTWWFKIQGWEHNRSGFTFRQWAGQSCWIYFCFHWFCICVCLLIIMKGTARPCALWSINQSDPPAPPSPSFSYSFPPPLHLPLCCLSFILQGWKCDKLLLIWFIVSVYFCDL